LTEAGRRLIVAALAACKAVQEDLIDESVPWSCVAAKLLSGVILAPIRLPKVWTSALGQQGN